MHSLEQMDRLAADLYWVAFLLTGDTTLSVHAAAEAIEAECDESRFFSAWMVAWSRKVVIDRALLAIDIFPRCALVLSIFENLSVEDVSILLDCGTELVRKGQMIGAQQLTGNLARMQDGTSEVAGSGGWNSEAQYA